jgi:hypothetical protein
MKKALAAIATVAVAGFGYVALSGGNVASPVPDARAAVPTYKATIYVAGMGGHFAVADIVVDPNDATQPIKIEKLDKIDIGDKNSHPTHDARIDNDDPNVMFWSTYKPDNIAKDPNNPGKLHVGKTDLKTGNVIKDVAVDIPAEATFIGANYCASGQSKNFFMPISMADKGYIDIFDKKTLELKKRVFFDELGLEKGKVTFAHGTEYPDGKSFLLTFNLTPEGHTKWTGSTHLYKVDLAALEGGKLVKQAEGEVTGVPGKSITFRQYFSADGKVLFQSGADRGYVIDANTLKLINEVTPLPGENHDFQPTPDGKFALMTLREKASDCDGKDSVDGTILLYDVEQKKTIGRSASVCFACHIKEKVGKAVLCGIDTAWK